MRDLEKQLKFYKTNCKHSSYDDCKQLAGSILDKWYAQWNEITTNYRHFKGAAESQKQFEQMLENERKRHKAEKKGREQNNEDDEEEEEAREPVVKKKQRVEGMQASS